MTIGLDLLACQIIMVVCGIVSPIPTSAFRVFKLQELSQGGPSSSHSQIPR